MYCAMSPQVSNESSDIVRMLNDLHLPGCTNADLVPAELRADIDKLNDQVGWGGDSCWKGDGDI